jgi:poly-gamma-glutamate synthesis protein (capsule biosynthesis protein)
MEEQAFDIASEALGPAGITVMRPAIHVPIDISLVSVSSGDQGATSFVAGYWVPVVGLSHPAEELSMAQLRDAVAGRLTGWAGITGDELPLRVLVASDRSPPIEAWFRGETLAVERLPLAELPAAVAGDPGAIALLPLDAVDARVRSLGVDGVNIVYGTGDASTYALAERVWIELRDVEDGDLSRALDDTANAIAARLGVEPPDPIILRATGDIIPSRCVYEKQRSYGDYRHAFLELGPWLAEADITAGSLDAALSDVSEPFPCVDTFNLMAPAASVEGLAYAGFDVITVATNHVKDCGQVGSCGDQAFFDTLENLASNGIAPVGGGADLAAARAPAFIESKGVRFAFLGYDEIAAYYHAEPGVAGTAPLNEAYVREDVAAAAQQADVVVVLPQWGVEYTADPNERQQALARAAAEAGAGLVIGNHPHWVEAAQVIDGVYVAYALGNFVFDQDWSLETQQGVVLEAAFHGATLKGVRYHPIHIYDEHQPAFADADEARQILDRIWDASALLADN